MQISDYLEHAVASARQTKEWACRRHPKDIAPYVCAYRGDEPVSLVTLRHHRRDEMLETCATCAAGFDADVISLAFETYVAVYARDSTFRGNPVTGRDWADGEMQDVVENHGGIEKGWVSEALSVSVVNRAGDVVMDNIKFHYSGKYLVWDASTGELGSAGTGRLSGLMVDALVRIMESPSASQVLPGNWDTFDRADRDILTVRYLNETFECAPLLFAEMGDDSRRRKLFKVGVEITPKDET